MVIDPDSAETTREAIQEAIAPNRRQFLRTTVMTVGTTATAGCLGNLRGGNDGQVNKISIIMENVYDTEVVKKLVPKFEEQSGFSVDIQTFPYGTMNEKIITQLQSSSSTYDVIIVDNPWVGNFVKGGLLKSLQGVI